MYTLRLARPSDLERLRQIHHVAFFETVSAMWGWDDALQDSMWDEYVKSASQLQVVGVDGEAVGYLDVDRRPDHIFIANIALDPEVQGRGIGTTILFDVIAEAHAADMPVRLDVIKTNSRARALYERLGFIWIGENESHDTMEAPV